MKKCPPLESLIVASFNEIKNYKMFKMLLLWFIYLLSAFVCERWLGDSQRERERERENRIIYKFVEIYEQFTGVLSLFL